MARILLRLRNDLAIESDPLARLPNYSDFCVGALDRHFTLPRLYPRYPAFIGPIEFLPPRRFGCSMVLGGTQCLLYTALVCHEPTLVFERCESDAE